jgi:hypothetical protein
VALFFVLIAIVPMAALIAVLLFLNQDSQRGKADARLAAGLKTALAVYQKRIDDAGADARRLARDPALATSLRGDPAGLQAWTRRAASGSGVVRVEVFDGAGVEIATAGDPDSVAFGRVGLTESSRSVGALRVSTTTGPQYVDEVKRLTGRELVLRRGGQVLAATHASGRGPRG